MKRDLVELASRKYDLVVIGAGVYGAAAAWDATLRGLSVALIDKGDWTRMRQSVKQAMDKAERRQDIYASNLFKSKPYVWCCIVDDRVDDAYRSLREAPIALVRMAGPLPADFTPLCEGGKPMQSFRMLRPVARPIPAGRLINQKRRHMARRRLKRLGLS